MDGKQRRELIRIRQLLRGCKLRTRDGVRDVTRMFAIAEVILSGWLRAVLYARPRNTVSRISSQPGSRRSRRSIDPSVLGSNDHCNIPISAHSERGGRIAARRGGLCPRDAQRDSISFDLSILPGIIRGYSANKMLRYRDTRRTDRGARRYVRGARGNARWNTFSSSLHLAESPRGRI